MKWRCGSDGPNDDRPGRTISSVDKKRKLKRMIMDRKHSLQCRRLDAAYVEIIRLPCNDRRRRRYDL